MQRLTHAGSLLCISLPVSVMWELMMLVWWSRRCHFPSSAAAVTWQPSEGSILGDKAALCLHTEFNHGLPHLHRPGWEAVRCESQSLWRWRWKEIWREEDSKKQSFVNRGGGEHMSLGKLSEGEIAFQNFPGMVHHHIIDHKIMGIMPPHTVTVLGSL